MFFCCFFVVVFLLVFLFGRISFPRYICLCVHLKRVFSKVYLVICPLEASLFQDVFVYVSMEASLFQ